MNPFTITPPRCTVTYTCTSVVRKDGENTTMGCNEFSFDGQYNNQATDGKLSITVTENNYKNNDYSPGVFEVTITGSVVGSDGPQTYDSTIEITLLDPCDPPISVTRAALVN